MQDLESNHMVVSEGAQQLESFRLEVSRLQADSEDLHKKLSEAEAQQLKLQIENDELHAKMESSKNESEEMNELKKKIEVEMGHSYVYQASIFNKASFSGTQV